MIIKNVRLYPIDSPVIEVGYLVVQEGKIVEIGPMSQLPDKDFCEVYDLPGHSVLPGLVDCHCHVGMFGNALGFENNDGNEYGDPCTPHVQALDAVNPFDRCFQEARENGVTTILTGPGSANPIAGQALTMKTVGSRTEDMVLKAPAAMKFAFGENPKRVYNERKKSPVTRMAVAAIMRESLAKAQEYAEKTRRAGMDGGSLPGYDARCEALIPVLEGKLPAHFHAHRAVDILSAMRIAREFNLKYVIVHGTEGCLVAGHLVEAHATVIAGPLISDRSKPELTELSIENPGILAEQGVKLAICTDHPVIPIQYLLLSAAMAVRGGMSREDALRAVTLMPAVIAGVGNRVGSLTEGKDADLLVVEGDPFDVTRRPKLVFINGEAVVS